MVGGYKKLNGSVGKETRFSSTNQPTPEQKREGHKKGSIRRLLVDRLSAKLFDVDAPEKAVEVAIEQLEISRDPRPLIKLLELVKLPDKQEVNMTGNVQVMPTVKIGGKELKIDIGEEPNGDGASDNS